MSDRMRRNEPMVVAFSSANYDGELEAMGIKALLDANEIPAILSGPGVLPSLAFEIQVPEHLAERAHEVIRDARQGGRRAAEVGEAEAPKVDAAAS